MPSYPKKKNIPLRIVLSIFCAALIALSGFICWQLGFIHATVLRFWYTPVSIELEMPSTASVNADLPARAFFFVNDNDLIPEVSGMRRVFYAVKNQNQKKNKIYKIRNVYLKPGLYRIKIVEGPYVWWNSIEVTSEKKNDSTGLSEECKKGS